MNLTITPFRTAKPMVSFKGYSGDCGDEDYNNYSSNDDDYKVDYSTYHEDLKRAETKGFNEGLMSGALGMTVLAVIAGAGGFSKSEEETDTFISTLNQISESDKVKQDSFMIKDMTDDNHPDLILYKKDGSKIVVDMKNKKVLEETKKLDIIE